MSATGRPTDGLTGFLELTLPAEARYLSLARQILRALAGAGGFSPDQSADAALCASEAMSTVIRQAASPWATLRVSADPLALRIEIEDGGSAGAARQQEGTERPQRSTVPLPPAGFGVKIIRALMDRVDVESGTHGTVVRMTKLRHPRPVAPAVRVREPLRTVGHVQRTLARYERDLGLMLGRLAPSEDDLDDLAILQRFVDSSDREALINDRKLRIKTLEATLEILKEDA